MTITLDGADLLDLQSALYPRFASLGVEKMSRAGRSVSLYGGENSRKEDVYKALEAAIGAHAANESRRDADPMSRGAS